MSRSPVYLDYNATTPCDPRVVDKMLPYFSTNYGNPSNGFHRQGRLSAKAVDTARELVAELIHANAGEIIFTSGATESNNLAILGTAHSAKTGRRKRIVTSAIEHKAVLLACAHLQQDGFEVIKLPVDGSGLVSLADAAEAITEDTLLVTIHAANNEVGIIQQIAELAQLAHQAGALFHCDAAQAVGKLPVDVRELDVDMLSMSAHKFYGPKGVGALFIRRGVSVEPLMYGGGQENGTRSGTTNVPGVVGLGEASRLCVENLLHESARIKTLRDTFETELAARIPDLQINAVGADRLPNTSSLTFPGVDADAMLLNLPDVMLGTGSACTSGAIEPSHVLTAMGLSRTAAASTVRVSLGRFTETEDMRFAVERIVDVYGMLASSLAQSTT